MAFISIVTTSNMLLLKLLFWLSSSSSSSWFLSFTSGQTGYQYVYPGYGFMKPANVSLFINRTGCPLTWGSDGSFCCWNGGYMHNQTNITQTDIDITKNYFYGNGEFFPDYKLVAKNYSSDHNIYFGPESGGYIDVTMVLVNGAYRNQIGIFQYQNGGIKPNSLFLIFNDFSYRYGSNLICHENGDTIRVGPFPSNSKIGLLINPNGASNSNHGCDTKKTDIENCLRNHDYSNPDYLRCYTSSGCTRADPNSFVPNYMYFSNKTLNQNGLLQIGAIRHPTENIIYYGFRDMDSGVDGPILLANAIVLVRPSVEQPHIIKACLDCRSIYGKCNFKTGLCSCKSNVPNLSFTPSCSTCYCGCLNDQSCNCTTGQCTCQPPYYGVKCQCTNTAPDYCTGPEMQWSCDKCVCSGKNISLDPQIHATVGNYYEIQFGSSTSNTSDIYRILDIGSESSFSTNNYVGKYGWNQNLVGQSRLNNVNNISFTVMRPSSAWKIVLYPLTTYLFTVTYGGDSVPSTNTLTISNEDFSSYSLIPDKYLDAFRLSQASRRITTGSSTGIIALLQPGDSLSETRLVRLVITRAPCICANGTNVTCSNGGKIDCDTGKCICKDGWEGDTCNCVAGCVSNGGICMRDGTCNCPFNQYGVNCSATSTSKYKSSSTTNTTTTTSLTTTSSKKTSTSSYISRSTLTTKSSSTFTITTTTTLFSSSFLGIFEMKSSSKSSGTMSTSWTKLASTSTALPATSSSFSTLAKILSETDTISTIILSETETILTSWETETLIEETETTSAMEITSSMSKFGVFSEGTLISLINSENSYDNLLLMFYAGLGVLGTAAVLALCFLVHRSRRRHRPLHDLRHYSSEFHLRSFENLYNMNHVNGQDQNHYIMPIDMGNNDHANKVPSGTALDSSTNALPIAIPGYMMLYFDIDITRPNLQETIGKGGYGSIFKGTFINPALIHKFGCESFAMKKSLAEGGTVNQAVKFELALISSLQSCENILKLFGYVEDNNAIWLIMKRYPFSLMQLLGKEGLPLSIGAKALIARDMCNGLKHIHRMNIIHLDIKPHNILVELGDETNIPKCVICDFGLARLVGAKAPVAGLTVPDTRGLTVRYTPPEVFQRLSENVHSMYEFSEIDKSIDIYALAITIFEVVTGQGFMKGAKDKQEICRRVLNGERMDFEAVPDLPGLSWAIGSGWEQSPRDRPVIDDIDIAANDDVMKLASKVSLGQESSLIWCVN